VYAKLILSDRPAKAAEGRDPKYAMLFATKQLRMSGFLSGCKSYMIRKNGQQAKLP
jgi:hypothetical protein